MHAANLTADNVLDTIRDLLLERLELKDRGLAAEQISPATLLLDEAGLALDSVEALDLLVGIEKAYQLWVENIDKDFIETHCHSVGSLMAYVQTACC